MKQFAEGVVLFILVAVVLASAFYLFVGGWPVESRLSGKLACVGIQVNSWGVTTPVASAWQGQWVWSDDPAFLARVESWLLTLERPACESALRQRINRLLLVFQDGREEELLFLGPDCPGPSAHRCCGFGW